ncbi:hypothetical protein ACFY7Y_03975 [Streptomyces virginiae]|uniref:hypothetical protein n=1 Tax=Streptomyces virginiae TaxID=1961 RepID=UPI0036B97E47
MLGIRSLNDIVHRLEQVTLSPWGPDGVRYVCVLLWDYQGYRQLNNQIDTASWLRWTNSSGQFWDLFLAGCTYGDHRDDRDRILPSRDKPLPLGLEVQAQAAQPSGWTYCWTQAASDRIADEMARKAHEVGAPRWEFTGPLELVAVGARRDASQVVIDWASLRSVKLSAGALAKAVSDYTEAHVSLDGDLVPGPFPTPGSFHDNLLPELKRDLFRSLGLLRFLLPR